MSSLVIFLVLFRINLLVTWTNCFNLSSVDSDELWHLLLNRQIGHNDSNAKFNSLPPPNYDNVPDSQDVVNAVVVHDNVNEFHYDDVVDVVDLNDDGVKVEYNDENKTIDKNLKSRFMDIFNVSVNDFNVTETADTIHNDTDVNSDDNLLFELPYNENMKFKREEHLQTTSSVIAIDVFKPSETESNSADESEMFRYKVHTKPKPGQTSLVIVFDGTGSMENCLIQLRAGAKEIIDKFSDRDDNPIYNYIFVPFRDPCKNFNFILIMNQTLLLLTFDFFHINIRNVYSYYLLNKKSYFFYEQSFNFFLEVLKMC